MRKILTFLAVISLLLLSTSLASGQPVRQPFEWIIAKQLTVNTTSTLTGDVTLGDDLTVTDLVTAADATVTDDLTTVDLYASQAASQTITAGGTITPTGLYHQITAAAARGTSSVAGVSTAGRVVTIVNVGSNTITLTDTGTLKLAGNAALGQYDSITLLSDGTNWIQVSKADN